VVLAIALHPAISLLQSVVAKIYPISDSLKPAMQVLQEMFQSANVWVLILVIAVLPALCEELAFRGFILSGFRHVGHKWRAILYSAIFFSLAHGIIQQSMIACMVGVIIGYLAVQTGSIFPCIAFHMVHNAMVVVNSRLTSDMFSHSSVLCALAKPSEGGGCTFYWPVVAACTLFALLPLAWFAKQPYVKSQEEAFEDVIVQAEKDDKSLATSQ
jgi:sodium transport system permease protein